jgi:hypothetical protein
MSEKTLDATSEADAKAKVGDVVAVGNTDTWRLICKASSHSQGWMKSTKAMGVHGGVVLQVSTQQLALAEYKRLVDAEVLPYAVAEALVLIPGVELEPNDDGKTWRVV